MSSKRKSNEITNAGDDSNGLTKKEKLKLGKQNAAAWAEREFGKKKAKAKAVCELKHDDDDDDDDGNSNDVVVAKKKKKKTETIISGKVHGKISKKQARLNAQSWSTRDKAQLDKKKAAKTGSTGITSSIQPSKSLSLKFQSSMVANDHDVLADDNDNDSQQQGEIDLQEQLCWQQQSRLKENYQQQKTSHSSNLHPSNRSEVTPGLQAQISQQVLSNARDDRYERDDHDPSIEDALINNDEQESQGVETDAGITDPVRFDNVKKSWFMRLIIAISFAFGLFMVVLTLLEPSLNEFTERCSTRGNDQHCLNLPLYCRLGNAAHSLFETIRNLLSTSPAE